MSFPRFVRIPLTQLTCILAVLTLSGCSGYFRPNAKRHDVGELNLIANTTSSNTPPTHPSIEPDASKSATNRVPHLSFPKLSLNQSLTELGFDGKYSIEADQGQATRVDAHSVLYLAFPTYQASTALAELDPAAKAVHDTLRFFEQVASRMDEINSRRINPQNQQQLKRLQQDAAEVAGIASRVVAQANKLGMDQDQLADIVLGSHPNLTSFPPSDNGYVNLGRWLSVELQNQRDAFHQLATNQQAKVMVQAFRESNGSKSALHVEGWDTFSAGPYEPIDRTGLRPTESEQERLNAKRQQAEANKKLYEAIAAKDSSLKQALRSKLKETEVKIGRLLERMKSSPADWSAAQFTAVSNRLAALAANDAQGAAAKLLGSIDAFHRDFNEAQALGNSIEQFVETLKNLNKSKPEELMFGGTSLFNRAGNIFQSLTNTGAKLPEIPQRIGAIQESLPAVGDEALEEQTRTIFQSVSNYFASLGQSFPAEATYLAGLWVTVTGTFQVAQGTDAVEKPEGDWMPRTLDNLEPGRLDLKRSGLALGDIVTLRMTVTNEATGEVLPAKLYETEIALMGLHGKPEVHFILARSLSGSSEATQWKPNVAAAVEWHYTIRQPAGGWGTAWNWLYPGAGIHLASLDQGEDSVELGAGGIVSLKDGLLTGGFGYNFSDNSDHTYVFIGVNLLSLLQQGKKQFR